MQVIYKGRVSKKDGSEVLPGGGKDHAYGTLQEIIDGRASIIPEGRTGLISIAVKDIVHAYNPKFTTARAPVQQEEIFQ